MTEKRKHGKHTFVEMTATCDESCTLYVNMVVLKDRKIWAAGWLQRKEIEDLQNEVSGKICKSCQGLGTIDCPLCSLSGKITEV